MKTEEHVGVILTNVIPRNRLNYMRQVGHYEQLYINLRPEHDKYLCTLQIGIYTHINI